MVKKEKVSIVKCHDYSVDRISQALAQLLEPIGGMGAYVNEGEKVLLKPNLLKASSPEKAVTTHPAVVAAVALDVKRCGGIPFIGDSPGIGNMKKIFDITGMTDAANRSGAELVEFKESKVVKTGDGAKFKTLEISKDVLEADKVINLAKVKTHAQMYVTIGVKNCFGCVVGKRKPQWHFKAGVTREHFADLLLDIYETVKPCLTIADGIIGMEGNGPGGGDPRQIGLLFASANALDMDRVVTEVLGLKAHEVPLFHSAIKRGMMSEKFEEIEICGPNIEEIKIKNYRPPRIIDMMFGPPFMRRYFKESVTAKPKVDHDKCTLCRDCIETCPTDVMSVANRKIEIYYRDCIHCFCCQEVCPEGAITPKQGWMLKLLGGRL